MNLEDMIAQLRAEERRLTEAIEAIEAIHSGSFRTQLEPAVVVKPPSKAPKKPAAKAKNPKRRPMV
jgi:hypothetical protein